MQIASGAGLDICWAVTTCIAGWFRIMTFPSSCRNSQTVFTQKMHQVWVSKL